jgi:hypothetical protein
MPEPDRDPLLPQKLIAAAKVARAERDLRAAVLAAMTEFLDVAKDRLLGDPVGLTAAAAPDPDAWPAGPEWVSSLDLHFAPVVGDVFEAQFNAYAAQVDVPVGPYRAEYLAQVQDRLTAWPAGAFEEVRRELQAGQAASETIPQLRDRVARTLNIDAPSRALQTQIESVERRLHDTPFDTDEWSRLSKEKSRLYEALDTDRGRWRWKADRIARTEAIGALNGGQQRGAEAWSKIAGVQLYHQWLAGHDSRTRKSHAAADGQIQPLTEPFRVGSSSLMHPGDPAGSAKELIQCRCTQSVVDAADVEVLTSYDPIIAAATEDTMTEPISAPVGDELPDGWRGPLIPLDTASGDGRRYMEPEGGVRWRDLPLTLMAMMESQAFHDGSLPAGRIDRIWVQDGMVWGEGSYDLAGEAGAEAARLLKAGMFRWVSVDLDDLSGEWVMLNPAGVPLTPEEIQGVEEAYWMDDPELSPYPLEEITEEFRGTDWRIMGATQLAHPAFQEAAIEPVYGYVPAETPVPAADLALVASAAPCEPPAAWFQGPPLTELTALTVTDDGRVFGHLAAWDSCHTGFAECVKPPRTASGYRFFHVGSVRTAEGGEVPVGKLTVGGGHAPIRGVSAAGAAAHYDNAGCAVAVVQASEDDYGIVVRGALVPTATDEQVAALRRSPLSGDWREYAGALELVAALAVNVPGFPVPRPAMAASGQRRVALVAAGIGPLSVLTRQRGKLAQASPRALAKLVAAELRAGARREAKRQQAAQRIGRDPATRRAAAAALVRGSAK